MIPVFNDWDSLLILLREVDQVAGSLPVRIAVSVINDGSTIAPPTDLLTSEPLRDLDGVEIIHLTTNVGHQRAIAVGLCAAVEDDNCDAILVMDADGEDSPHAISQMFQAAGNAPEFCVVAKRGKRTETFTFQIAYLLYKLLFKLLTGHQINFGNFCLLSQEYARRLVHIPDLWNSLPAAVLRSRLPIKAVPIDRARRYVGESKMNLTSLVVHGFSGISVYAETIFVRFFFLTLALFLLSAFSIPFVVTLRIFFPRYATPGWATTVSFGVTMVLVQTMSFTLSFILMLLNSRMQPPAVPLISYRFYVDQRQIVLAPRCVESGR